MWGGYAAPRPSAGRAQNAPEAQLSAGGARLTTDGAALARRWHGACEAVPQEVHRCLN